MADLDLRAVALGTASALIIIVPAAILARIFLGDDPSDGWSYAFVGLVLVATLLGSFGAGRRVRDTPMLHGSLAALATFVLAQLFWSLVNAEVPNLVGVVFFGLLFMCLGAVGGFVATMSGTTAEGGAP